MDYSEVRYLHSKKSIDDRALNRHVLHTLREGLARLGAPRPRVLELGAGVGTMLSRLVEWGVLSTADYTLLDRDGEALGAARSHVEGVPATRDGSQFAVELVHGDAFEFLATEQSRHRYDLVVANAVLDLMDLKPALDHVFRALRPGALYWFTINFDGETLFLPESPLDRVVTALYHRTMDERVRDGKPCGDSKTGRHLLQRLLEVGARVDAAGSSDWVVFPEHGVYPGDEAYFLHHIVNTIWLALRDDPGLAHTEGPLTATALDRWISERHSQIDSGALTYIAHQLDVVGAAPPVPGQAT